MKKKSMKKIIELVNAEKFDVLTSEDKKNYINYSICKNHSGKMSGFNSISTSCKDNTICKERAKNGNSICAHCFAQRQLSYQKTTRRKLHTNYQFYTSIELTENDIPFINNAFFRFESFGDLQNMTQFNNYCTIAKCNEHCRFALWTKNAYIIRSYVYHGGKIPENLSIIFSSPMINHQITIEDLQELDFIYFVNAVFTVYDTEHATNNGININCGSRSCAECRKCYTLDHSKVTFINELLK